MNENAEYRIIALRAIQGWNDQSMIDLLTRFIVAHDDMLTGDRLAAWLEKQADAENKAAAAAEMS